MIAISALPRLHRLSPQKPPQIISTETSMSPSSYTQLRLCREDILSAPGSSLGELWTTKCGLRPDHEPHMTHSFPYLFSQAGSGWGQRTRPAAHLICLHPQTLQPAKDPILPCSAGTQALEQWHWYSPIQVAGTQGRRCHDPYLKLPREAVIIVEGWV